MKAEVLEWRSHFTVRLTEENEADIRALIRLLLAMPEAAGITDVREIELIVPKPQGFMANIRRIERTP